MNYTEKFRVVYLTDHVVKYDMREEEKESLWVKTSKITKALEIALEAVLPTDINFEVYQGLYDIEDRYGWSFKIHGLEVTFSFSADSQATFDRRPREIEALVDLLSRRYNLYVGMEDEGKLGRYRCEPSRYSLCPL